MNRGDIIEELKLQPFSSQGWMHNKENCPYCGKNFEKWGLIFNERGGGVFHCWRCGTKAPLWDFLKKIGREDLGKRTYEISISKDSPKLIKSYELGDETGVNDEDNITYPDKLTPLENDKYLNERGFLPCHYEEFEPSEANPILDPKLRDSILFKIKRGGRPVAWLARSRKSKEWHQKNLDNFKRGLEPLRLRYRNSETDFRKIVGGIDTVKEGVEELFIVEGLFDKVGIDNLLRTDKYPEKYGCVFTFGKSIDRAQIDIIKTKHPRIINLMYDEDAEEDSYHNGLKLSQCFEEVYIWKIPFEGVDPGIMTLSQFVEIEIKYKYPVFSFPALKKL